MQAVTRIQSTTVVLPTRDIDTDQIIPARFLTATSRQGFGAHLFHDLRFHNDGSMNPAFALNQPAAKGCEVLVAGNNFGCGSSREHAIWALLDYGIRAVVSTEIADIFRNNGLKNGLLPIVVDAQTHQWLIEHPAAEVVIDVGRRTLQFAGDRTVTFPIDDFARYCLIEGIDQLGFLRQRMQDIETFERSRPWTP